MLCSKKGLIMCKREFWAFLGWILLIGTGLVPAHADSEDAMCTGSARREKGLVLSTPPAVLSIRSGGHFSINVTASGGTAPYTYQWERSTQGVWENVPEEGLNPVVLYAGTKQLSMDRTISGTHGETLVYERAFKDNGGAVCQPAVPIEVLDEGDYRLFVQDSLGETAQSAITHVSIDDTQVNIAVYPETARKYVGDAVSFSVTAVGGHGPYVTYPPDGYQFTWEVNHEAAGSGTVNGCVSTLFFPYVEPRTDLVTVYVEDHSGGASTQDDTTLQPAYLIVRDPVSATAPGYEHRNVGQIMTFQITANGGHPPYTYQWKKEQGVTYVDLIAGDQPSGSHIASVTEPLLSIHNVQLGDDGFYRCYVVDSVETGSCSQAYSPRGGLSVTERLSVTPVSLIGSTYGGTSLYEGGFFSLGVTAAGGKLPYVYRWYQNGAQVQAGTMDHFTVNDALPQHGGAYVCVVEDSSADPDAVSNPGKTITVFSDLAITSSPDPYQEVNAGESVSFHVTAAGGWVVPPQVLRYQWQHGPLGAAEAEFVEVENGSWVNGAQTPDLTITQVQLSDQGDYRCVVRDYGPGPQEARSASGALHVTNFIFIPAESQPKDRQVYTGDSIRLAVVVTGGTPPYDFVWTKVGAGEAGHGDALEIQPAQLTDAGGYFVTCSDSGGHPAIQSRVAQVNVYRPLIVTDPQDMAVHEGGQAVFNVAAAYGIPAVSFRWYANVGGGGFMPMEEGDWNGTGVKTPVLNITPVAMEVNGALFHCRVEAQPSDDPASPLGKRRVVTMNAVLEVAESFTIHTPPDQAVYVGSEADPVFTLAASVTGGGRPAGYEWQRRKEGESNFVAAPDSSCCGNLDEFNSAVLSIVPASESPGVYDYRVEISDGIGQSLSSLIAIEFDRHISITEQPHDIIVRSGGVARFRCRVEGGLGARAYEWQKHEEGEWQPIPGANAAVCILEDIGIEDETEYRCIVSDSGSTITGRNDCCFSASARLTIGNPVPVMGKEWLFVTACLLGMVFYRMSRVKSGKD